MRISGASREVMEGLIALFAVAVLLYVGFWLHRQTEVGRWKKFVQETVKGALDAENLWLIAGISFMAVFREVIEVVLFLRAIWLDVSQTGKFAMGAGVVSSFVLIVIFSILAIKFSRRIPIKQLFTVSSVILSFLAVTLMGKGIHALQEAGWIGVNSINAIPKIDILGIFPSIQVVLSQLVVLALLYALWIYGKKPEQKAL